MAKEHSIFISYRQVDGSKLAEWIFNKLLGKSIVINNEYVILSPQLDKAIPSGFNWKRYLDSELENACTLLVVCSPATMNKYVDRDDFFYHEIEWWVKNRKKSRPVLITTEQHGYNIVPQLIIETWENIQVAKLNEEVLTSLANDINIHNENIFLESITRGISNPLTEVVEIDKPSGIFPQNFNIDGFFVWEKDRHGKYIYVNEDYARAAGCDSPAAMKGKTDFDVVWRSLAPKFIEGDRKIMFDDELLRIDGVFEKEIMVEKVADIFVKEGVLKDHSGRNVGVVGCFVDVTAGLNDLLHKRLRVDDFGIYLNNDLGHQHLTNIEMEVLKGRLKAIPKEKIALDLNKTLDEIKSVIRSLKIKFQCTSENQLLVAAIRAGLPLQFYG